MAHTFHNIMALLSDLFLAAILACLLFAVMRMFKERS